MSATSRAFLFFSTLVAALGGFLFGFDTAVISGTTAALERVFGLDGFWLGFVVAAALLGTIAGASGAARLAERLGRRRALLAAALLYLLATAGSATAQLLPVLLLFRFLGGVALGTASVVTPMYIAEIAPARLRGRLVAVNQLNVVTGILLGYLSNFLLAQRLDALGSWRWMLAVEALPAGIFLALLFLVPESPRWLVGRGRTAEAFSVLRRVGADDPVGEVRVMAAAVEAEAGESSPGLFERRHALPIFLAVTVALLNQLSGVNALLFYAPRVFQMAGAAAGDALLQAATIGGTNLLFTALALFLIDRAGRRPLLMVGGAGAAVCLALTAYGLSHPGGTGRLVLAGLLGFVAFHAIGQGAVIWVFISEIFPNRVRGKGQALGSLTHWTAAALVSWSFPGLVRAFGGPVFGFFSAMMALQLLFAWKLMPETRGLSLEEVERRLAPAGEGYRGAALAGGAL
jgi:SP family xylose:H+ symportor-like MFS transporter